MKQSLLSMCLFVAVTLGVTAQNNLTIPSLDLNVWGSAEVSLMQTDGTVENTFGAVPIDVKVRRITVDTVPGTENYFCWEQCYIPSTNVSPTSITIDPSDRFDLFYADYKPHGNAGTSTLIYCFYDENNEVDSVCATVRFTASPVGIQDVFMGNESGISESYPNPATEMVNINYALHQGWQKAELLIYNMLGSMAAQVDLKDDQGTLKLDVSSLPTGMYFYTLMVDGNAAGTRKMLITE